MKAFLVLLEAICKYHLDLILLHQVDVSLLANSLVLDLGSLWDALALQNLMAVTSLFEDVVCANCVAVVRCLFLLL